MASSAVAGLIFNPARVHCARSSPIVAPTPPFRVGSASTSALTSSPSSASHPSHHTLRSDTFLARDIGSDRRSGLP